VTLIRRIIQRQTKATHRGRPLVIELHPGFLAIWPKGNRERYTITYEAIFSRAALLSAGAFDRGAGRGLGRRLTR
jgi:hypothetical protein